MSTRQKKFECFDTVTAQVAAVLSEQFADAEPFCTREVQRVLPWVEDDATSRVSAALYQLVKTGAVLLLGLENGRAVFITDRTLLALYEPKVRKRKYSSKLLPFEF